MVVVQIGLRSDIVVPTTPCEAVFCMESIVLIDVVILLRACSSVLLDAKDGTGRMNLKVDERRGTDISLGSDRRTRLRLDANRQ